MAERRVLARFTTTPGEFVEAIKTLSGVLYGFKGQSRAAGVWKGLILCLIVGMLFFVLLTIIDAVARQPGGFTSRDLVVAVVSALATAWVLMLGLGRFQMRRVRAALANHPAQEDVEVVADDMGLWWNTAAEKHFWLYSRFDRVVPFKDGYYLVTGLSGAFIPGRGFADAAAKASFEDLMREKLSPGAALFFAAKRAQSG